MSTVQCQVLGGAHDMGAVCLAAPFPISFPLFGRMASVWCGRPDE